ncbi:MAG: HoxN/HupN/NixA family nickel/cobalt transporter [Actinobacteria bacterium]|nr:HoxN/HupN/NixA family nickel/cobalt transporter [Actinomycetota bacterium]
MGAVIVILHALGWGTLLALVVPQQLALGTGQVFGIGLGVTAYTLGMRHAFDADHIAAIDNATRAQLAAGRRPLSVGFWFSLGHSSVVFVLVALLAAGVGAVATQLVDDRSVLLRAMSTFGTLVSGIFLVVIGLVNLVVLAGIARVFRGLRAGMLDERQLEAQLQRRGVLARLTSRAVAVVTKPRQLYPVGLLFGLGFDTATEVGLLVLAGGAAAVSLPWYAILTLPVLFAAGMCLLDTVDGVVMTRAYGWADVRPVRKVYYNLTVTGLSVVVALVIGGIELLGVLADRLGITTGPLAAIASLDLGAVGYLVVVLFLAAWAVAVVVWRLARIEERWSPSP